MATDDELREQIESSLTDSSAVVEEASGNGKSIKTAPLLDRVKALRELNKSELRKRGPRRLKMKFM